MSQQPPIDSENGVKDESDGTPDELFDLQRCKLEHSYSQSSQRLPPFHTIAEYCRKRNPNNQNSILQRVASSFQSAFHEQSFHFQPEQENGIQPGQMMLDENETKSHNELILPPSSLIASLNISPIDEIHQNKFEVQLNSINETDIKRQKLLTTSNGLKTNSNLNSEQHDPIMMKREAKKVKEMKEQTKKL